MAELPETMAAMLLTGHGGLDKLTYKTDWPCPRPGASEVLVRVGACGINNTDINTRTGWYSRAVSDGTTAEGGRAGFAEVSDESGGWGGGIAFPRIQGADVAGEVVALGAGAPADLLGRRVLIDTWLRDWDDPLNPDKFKYFGSEVDGGFAQYATAPAANVHPIESDLSDAELATFATSSITAENMLRRAEVSKGDVVLIPGASGGVGSALVQLVRRRGAVPIALCGTRKADAVKAIGAEAVLPREPEDLGAALKEAVGRESVDVVADVVGGPLWPQLIDCLRRGGRYTCAGAIAGPIVRFDLRAFYLNDLVFTGATVIPPGLFAELVGYIARGEIRPLLAGTWKLEDLKTAQEAFLEKKHVGNFAVIPPD
ncbi:MAG TPA: alcohol dehydrogenase family protein [Kiloniellaceae bacterium]|nr:alcohol dehydrogenase family protein [Kiloniellaceae bacterium]